MPFYSHDEGLGFGVRFGGKNPERGKVFAGSLLVGSVQACSWASSGHNGEEGEAIGQWRGGFILSISLPNHEGSS